MKKGIVVFLAVMLMAGVASAQIQFGVGGGVSSFVKLGTDELDLKDYVKMGFNGNASIFLPLGEKLYIGGRVAYNMFSMDTDKLMEDLGEGLDIDVEASVNIIELLPSIRYFLAQNMFLQVGGGLYLSKTKMKVSYMGVSTDFGDEDFGSDFGATVGFGIGFGQFHILPMYHMIFVDEGDANYFSVNLGIDLN